MKQARYVGQGSELRIPLGEMTDPIDIAEAFSQRYERQYGARDPHAIEGVTWYLAQYGVARKARRPSLREAQGWLLPS